jgi:putative ABC transport system permease protein
MSGVWLRLGFEMRARWRSWLGVAVLVGLVAGAAAAAAAGARRTETAYPRFVQASNQYDLVTGGFPDDVDPDRALAALSAMPEVSEWARLDLVADAAELPSGRFVSAPELAAVTDLSGRVGVRLGRFKVLSGRAADPDAADEAIVGFATADREGIGLGSTIRFVVGRSDVPRFAAVRIVGIVAMPGDFPAVGISSAFGSVMVTPAFVRSHQLRPSSSDASLLIRLRHGAADADSFLAHVAAAGLAAVDIPYSQPVQTAAVQRSIRFESQTLWVLSGLIALAAFVIFGQTLAGRAEVLSRDFPTLQALGMSRTQLFVLGLLRAALTGALAAVVAVVTAACLSPLTPISLARIAEPHPGFDVDAAALAVAAVVTVLLTTLAAALPAWSAARGAPSHATRSPIGSDGPAGPRLRWLSVSPAAAFGTRIAFVRRTAGSAIPVRSGVVGATLSIVALTASVIFGSSLRHLLDTPRLSGFTWDAFVAVNDDSPRVAAQLRADPLVDGYARGGFDAVRVASTPVTAFISDGSGSAKPVVLAGRAPANSDEIALGSRTMRDTGVSIGQTIAVMSDDTTVPARRRVPMRVVGAVVVPPNPFVTTNLGEGAAMTVEGFLRLAPDSDYRRAPYLIRFRPGTDQDAALSALSNRIRDLRPFIVTAERPGKIATLAGIAAIPLTLSLLLLLIALASLTHLLLRSTRARRRDLAVLTALGFVRGQVQATIAWQAAVLTTVAVLIGLPVGIAAGRWGWITFAAQLGVLPEPVIPVLGVLLALPAALTLAIALGLIIGRAAARPKNTAHLRSE